MVAADSTTDSQLFHGSPISSALFKKPKANWLRKLKQWKTDDPRRSQWIHQRKRANVVAEEEEDGCSRLRSLRDIKTLSDRFSQAWSTNHSDDDDETGLSAATSVDDEDCFCCSKEVTEEEEEEFLCDENDNSSDDYSDALRMLYDEDPSQSNESSSTTAKPPEKPTDDEKKEEDENCPLCTHKMDATDLLFKSCSHCVFKMCLFCYDKWIKEGNGVCPGCRRKYEKQTSGSNSGVVAFQQPGGGDPIPLSSSFQGLDDSA